MKQQEMPKKNFYVGIKDPREVRRNLLEASKAAIMSIQTNQRLKNIQKEKDELKDRLKKDVKELRMLLQKLDKLMPEHEEAKQKEVSLKKGIKTPRQENYKDFDRIEAHLSMIEEKLKKLK